MVVNLPRDPTPDTRWPSSTDSPLVGQFVKRAITTQPFHSGNPVPLRRTCPVAAPVTPRTYDVLRDGRVLGVVAQSSTDPQRTTGVIPMSVTTAAVIVVLNWFDDLKAKVKPH